MCRRFGDRRITMDRRKLPSEGRKLFGRDATVDKEVVQFILAAELAHFHGVLDELPPAINLRVALRRRDSAYVNVELRRETPVETQLFATKMGASLAGAQIDERKVDGTLDLVSELASEQHPGDVCLNQRDLTHRVRVRSWLQQSDQMLRQTRAHLARQQETAQIHAEQSCTPRE
jgi:hypothetical protein